MQEVPGPLEAQLRFLVQQQVGFVGATQPMTEFDIRAWPAWADLIVGAYPDQQAGREQRDQGGRLNLISRILDEARNLTRRFTSASLDAGRVAVSKIG